MANVRFPEDRTKGLLHQTSTKLKSSGANVTAAKEGMIPINVYCNSRLNNTHNGKTCACIVSTASIHGSDAPRGSAAYHK